MYLFYVSVTQIQMVIYMTIKTHKAEWSFMKLSGVVKTPSLEYREKGMLLINRRLNTMAKSAISKLLAHKIIYKVSRSYR